MSNIGSVGSIGAVPIRPPQSATDSGTSPGAFGDILSNAIQRVEDFRLAADQKTEKFLAGEGEDLHSVALATQQAELAFELFVQVRNKVVQAYQEMMRMQV